MERIRGRACRKGKAQDRLSRIAAPLRQRYCWRLVFGFLGLGLLLLQYGRLGRLLSNWLLAVLHQQRVNVDRRPASKFVESGRQPNQLDPRRTVRCLLSRLQQAQCFCSAGITSIVGHVSPRTEDDDEATDFVGLIVCLPRLDLLLLLCVPIAMTVGQRALRGPAVRTKEGY